MPDAGTAILANMGPRSGLRSYHWAIIGLVSLVIHAAAFVSLPLHIEEGAMAAGDGGFSFAVSMVAARAGSDADAPEPTVAETEPTVTLTEQIRPQAPPEVLTQPAVAVAVRTTVPSAVPETPPDTVRNPAEIAVEAPAEPATETATAVAAPPSPAPRPAAYRPVPPRKIVAPKVVSETPEASLSEPVATTRPHDMAVAEATDAASRQSAPSARTGAGLLNEAAEEQGGDHASLSGGGAARVPSNSYMNQLRYWLDRNKTYPKDARRKRMQGVVHLHFRVTRDGIVLNYRIQKSSGYAALDSEAEAMLKRAQPLPRFPESMKGGYLDVAVPVEFSLRGNS